MRSFLLVIAIVALLLSGCGGSSSSGAGGSTRVPLTEADKQAVEMLGGFGGEWLPQTQNIIRLDEPPPDFANNAVAWQRDCRYAFTVYNTAIDKSPAELAWIFAHEGQHHVDGCKIGPKWEKRANNAALCFWHGVPRNECNFDG